MGTYSGIDSGSLGLSPPGVPCTSRSISMIAIRRCPPGVREQLSLPALSHRRSVLVQTFKYAAASEIVR